MLLASLFINVSSEETIKIVLKRIYVNEEITTDTLKQEMKELFILCTKTVCFTLTNQI